MIGVHTAENTIDLTGVDTGAENVAQFILTRVDPGSYHTLVDADSTVRLAPYVCEVWGITSLNNHALHLSFAVEESKWLTIPQPRRETMVIRGAHEASAMADWLLENYGIVVPARWLTADEAKARVPGFVRHSTTDPDRRTDPGADFDADLFMTTYAALRSATPAPAPTPTPVPTPTPTPPASYLPLPLSGNFDTPTVTELQRALERAGYYLKGVDGAMGQYSWKGYQQFLTAQGFYSGLIDGDFGELSTKAEQGWLSFAGFNPGPVDGVRGRRTVSALQAALNAGVLKREISPVATWANPAEGRITSGYKTPTRPTHMGIDIAPVPAGSTGRPIYAVASGVVETTRSDSYAGDKRPGVLKGHTGNGVLVSHAGNVKTYYGHMSAIYVKAGQKIKAGQKLGTMGNTGNSTGVHLHLGVLVNGEFSNPYSFMKSKGVSLGVGSGGGSAPSQVDTYLPLTVDGVDGSHTITERQRALARGGFYKGQIDGANGPQTRTAYQAFLKARGFYTGELDGDFGEFSRKAEQRWLQSRGLYSGLIDGVRGIMTVKGLQTALNKGLLT